MTRPYVLSIAGFDPSAGAGVVADCKTFEQCGVHGLGVCSALTYQSDIECLGVEWLAMDKIEAQLRPLLKRFPIRWAKIGLVESIERIAQIVACVSDISPNVKFVWDPILEATAGYSFHSQIDGAKVAEALESVYIVTPNHQEARSLSGERDVLCAALKLSQHCAVYLKGGDAGGEMVEDILISESEALKFTAKRISGAGKHGTGCVFSSAMLAHLARGAAIGEACASARKYVINFISSTRDLLGMHATVAYGDIAISPHYSGR